MVNNTMEILKKATVMAISLAVLGGFAVLAQAKTQDNRIDQSFTTVERLAALAPTKAGSVRDLQLGSLLVVMFLGAGCIQYHYNGQE